MIASIDDVQEFAGKGMIVSGASKGVARSVTEMAAAAACNSGD